jgi:hypothetical protein
MIEITAWKACAEPLREQSFIVFVESEAKDADYLCTLSEESPSVKSQSRNTFAIELDWNLT